jgi:hypothetical protein
MAHSDEALVPTPIELFATLCAAELITTIRATEAAIRGTGRSERLAALAILATPPDERMPNEPTLTCIDACAWVKSETRLDRRTRLGLKNIDHRCLIFGRVLPQGGIASVPAS